MAPGPRRTAAGGERSARPGSASADGLAGRGRLADRGSAGGRPRSRGGGNHRRRARAGGGGLGSHHRAAGGGWKPTGRPSGA
ncbi:hypothetical protein MYX64_05990 [Nitrospinae bacterium AH_259_B05_G02_I21]|nr:hypothetical protein [Nitrospinae bacterium AH_259_B05_G02_I21]